jgi:hypothetical protein
VDRTVPLMQWTERLIGLRDLDRPDMCHVTEADCPAEPGRTEGIYQAMIVVPSSTRGQILGGLWPRDQPW